MSGGAGDVIATEDQIRIARNGLFMQLKANTKMVEVYGSLSEAIDALGLSDWIEHETKVRAQQIAWVHRTEIRMLNELHSKPTPDMGIDPELEW